MAKPGQPLNQATIDKLMALHAKGLKQDDIAVETQIAQSTVSKHLKRNQPKGLHGR
jgi:DNA-binding MarR family transcriptional regulator